MNSIAISLLLTNTLQGKTLQQYNATGYGTFSPASHKKTFHSLGFIHFQIHSKLNGDYNTCSARQQHVWEQPRTALGNQPNGSVAKKFTGKWTIGRFEKTLLENYTKSRAPLGKEPQKVLRTPLGDEPQEVPWTTGSAKITPGKRTTGSAKNTPGKESQEVPRTPLGKNHKKCQDHSWKTNHRKFQEHSWETTTGSAKNTSLWEMNHRKCLEHSWETNHDRWQRMAFSH